jgi:hypothetical protein
MQDVRYAIRALRRNPLFAATAACSLAIGIGANATVVSVANAVLLRTPAGVSAPNRLVDIGVSQNGQGLNPVSYPNYLDIRDRSTTLADVNASQLTTDATVLTRASGTDREQIAATSVTGNYFRMIDATPAVGRFFSPDDVRVRRSSVCRI